jgi:hypothetical protein
MRKRKVDPMFFIELIKGNPPISNAELRPKS